MATIEITGKLWKLLEEQAEQSGTTPDAEAKRILAAELTKRGPGRPVDVLDSLSNHLLDAIVVREVERRHPLSAKVTIERLVKKDPLFEGKNPETLRKRHRKLKQALRAGRGMLTGGTNNPVVTLKDGEVMSLEDALQTTSFVRSFGKNGRDSMRGFEAWRKDISDRVDRALAEGAKIKAAVDAGDIAEEEAYQRRAKVGGEMKSLIAEMERLKPLGTK